MADDDKKAAKAAAKEEKRRKKLEKKGIDPNDPDAEDEEDGIGTKIAIFFATIIIIAIWLAIVVLIIKWDVGGFGSRVMYPLLKDVPYVNKILPEVREEETDAAYTFSTIDEAVDHIKQLEVELAEAQEKIKKKNERINSLKSRIEKLEEYETRIKEYEALKEKFDREVVFSDEAPDISNYIEYYQAMNPENAEEIYREVMQEEKLSSELQDYVKAYSSMKAKKAAGIFDTMTDDLQLVAKILENMDADARGAILAEMNAETAARVTEIMNPK